MCRLVLCDQVGPYELELSVVTLGPDVYHPDDVSHLIAGEFIGGWLVLNAYAVDSSGWDMRVRDTVKVPEMYGGNGTVGDVEFEVHAQSRMDVQYLHISGSRPDILTLKTASKNWPSYASPSRHNFLEVPAGELPS
jgi:hypothetical protein